MTGARKYSTTKIWNEESKSYSGLSSKRKEGSAVSEQTNRIIHLACIQNVNCVDLSSKQNIGAIGRKQTNDHTNYQLRKQKEKQPTKPSNQI
jgi:hypothetical protein